MSTTKLAIFISGRGSNMQSILDACESDNFPAEVVLVVSDTPGAEGLAKAEKAGIAHATIERSNYDDKQAFEDALDRVVRESGAEMICLAGFMRVLGAHFVNKWDNKILNIHPSLLPSFRGLHTHQQALDAGVRFSGCTVHIVRPALDDGPIVVQAVVPVNEGDTADSLSARILHYEHVLYPEAIRLLCTGEAKVVGDKVDIAKGRWQVTGLVNPAPFI